MLKKIEKNKNRLCIPKEFLKSKLYDIEMQNEIIILTPIYEEKICNTCNNFINKEDLFCKYCGTKNENEEKKKNEICSF